MEYSYYPGCSLDATGLGYGLSVKALEEPLGMKLIEIPDWNCCGATPYFSAKQLGSFALPARNLAIAEQFKRDVVTPCSACFLVLNKVNHYIHEDEKFCEKLNEALAAGGLKYTGSIKVRHLTDVILNDIGIPNIAKKVKKPLAKVKVASYYGCQMVRPKYGAAFDDEENPTSLDNLVKALGGQPTDFPLKAKCCGGATMVTDNEMALKLCRDLLQSAKEGGADCIITTCPLCYTNLDAFQKMVNDSFGTDYDIPILFFTQLIGIALGVEGLGLETGIPSTVALLEKCK
jgi:heterodisulfide reductase subunit B